MCSGFIHRPVLLSKNGLVTAGHHLASLVGVNVLESGGNAFDSAIATSAVLSVVRPHMGALGGDAFALLYRGNNGKIEALNASGPAPLSASRDWFLEKGQTSIPTQGISAVSVPGLADSWAAISEKYGTMDLHQLLGPAVKYAKEGFPVYAKLRLAIKEANQKLSIDPPAAGIFLRPGRALLQGELLLQTDLAKTLEQIARDPRAFYEGSIARTIAEHSRELGGQLGADDLADYRSAWMPTICTSYRGYLVHEQPPVSQGHVLLQELNIVGGFDLARLRHNTADSIHIMVEAKKLAFADRLRYLSDPDFVKIPMEMLLSEEHAAEQREQITTSKTITTKEPREQADRSGGETTYFSIVDKHGNAVSFIQSIMSSFGSGVVVDGTGIVLNNRLSAFSLQSNHPNRLEPGKRTAHTLNSYMVMNDGNLFMVGGTPGLDDQIQVNLQVISNVIDHHMNVQEAIEAPRWSSKPGTSPGTENDSYELWLENRIPLNVRDELVGRGHLVKMSSGWSFGGVQAILIDCENRVLMGGADPRRDGYAIGW